MAQAKKRPAHANVEVKTMRILSVIGAAALVAAQAGPAWAEEAFDACEVFTQADAEKALGAAAAPEPVNPKVKRPKVVPHCTYTGFKDNQPITASVQFRFGKNDAETRAAFDENKLQFQTKPIILPGIESAFWSAKTGQMNIRKGRTWVTLSVGTAKISERQMDDAKKLAEILAKKI
jgi:hypothetical protein